jgi:aspartate aminotransferase
MDAITSKPFLAARVGQAKESATKAMTARAKTLRAQGRDVIVLSQGEPDFDTPDHVREAAVRAIAEGRTRYTAVPGITELREAISEKLRRDNGLNFAVDTITVGTGAKQLLFNALLATVEPGDEVIVPAPCWVSYPEMVTLAGGCPVVVHCDSETGFKLTPEQLEQAIGPRTKWLMLNSPCNPTGVVYSAEELKALAAVLMRHPHVWVLADDIYEKLTYAPAEFATLPGVEPELLDRTLVVNGVSKAYCMTGWRIGYGAGPLKLIKAINLIQSQSTSHACSIAQWAAVAAINGPQDALETNRAAFRRRRDLVVDQLNAAPGLSCKSPDGAFYVFADCTRLLGGSAGGGVALQNDVDVCNWLLESAGVAVVPGTSFLGPGHFRLSYATSDEELVRACSRISDVCSQL